VKKYAPGLKCRNVPWTNGSEGANKEFVHLTRPASSSSTPNLFFDASGPAQKAVPVFFFWGGFDGLFFFKFFSYLRGISVGELSESKILKTSGHIRKPQKLGTLYRKAG
jgi:hypothetical protein